jgi:hypothetical protein
VNYVAACRLGRLFRWQVLIKEAMITLHCPSRLK